MKVIEHIKPKGECTLKVKVWLWDKRIQFQVLEQKKRAQPGDGLYVFASTPLCVYSNVGPCLAGSAIWLRGRYVVNDLRKPIISFDSNKTRDAYYAKMKVALAAAAEAMK